MQRRVVIACAVATAVCCASAAAASVGTIDLAAESDRTAFRPNPPFQPDMTLDELAAQEVVDLVNRERNRRALPNFQVDELVTAAALAHSSDMAARRRLDHFGVTGADTGDRLDREGFAWRDWGEAIGAGYQSPTPLLEAWMSSDAHRAHLLGDQRYIGVGVVATPDGVPYWTLVVAT